ncbi:AMP-binding protein [Nostoc sp. CENA67]|uniref:AMP-binding protein n=1 Tax=Amazonocrinis nigriterrae CENA67 TaxID=2794033 RepID=A0A8J7HT84_9NOST|nr:AMP-binding protein [Amazonocrinis nigriterrae]MBH8565272.1 AMP-binding protein [Amazonocrinis nigriterrae CENA67]
MSDKVELLDYRAQNQPGQKAFTFLRDGEIEEASLNYRELQLQAQAIASCLQSLGAAGGRALLLYPPSLEFINAFLGCLYAGVVAVPAYPPRPNMNLLRLQAIVTDAQATLVLTSKSLLASLETRFSENPELATIPWLTTDNIDSNLSWDWQQPRIEKDTLAFLQYTSGSTGTPKGVMITHENLLANEKLIKISFGNSEKTIGVSWLPLFHDMGLIGNVLQPIYLGIPSILMSPVAFLHKPFCWLQAISRYKGTCSGGPNFAYDLCVRKITPEQRSCLDLSSWEVAFNAAEPVLAETIERFTNYFAPCGFRPEAFYPCYGMAESTLFISGGLKTAPPVLYQVEAAALEDNRVVAATELKEGVKTIVGCGRSWLDQKIIIVDPETFTQCSAGKVGEIWVSRDSVAAGYWNRREQTKESLQAYLADTGEGPATTLTFEQLTEEISYSQPQIKIIVNDKVANSEIATPQYWVQQGQQAGQFVDSMATLQQLDMAAFVEISPKPTLISIANQYLPEDTRLWLSSLNTDIPDWQQLLENLTQLYVRGVVVDWSGFDRDYPRKKVALPTYPFERQRNRNNRKISH